MKVLVLQTSISDHYKLIGTVLRQTFAKGKPKTFFYSCYQNLDKVQFEDTLKQELLLAINFDLFYATFKSIRDKFYNSQPLWQNLFEKHWKTIQQRQKLQTTTNKRQRKFCVKFLEQTKINYLIILNVKDLTDNKRFWKTVKPFMP